MKKRWRLQRPAGLDKPSSKLHRTLVTLFTVLLSMICQISAGAPQEPLESLVNIRFQNDIRVFAVMAALNAAGFDAETPGREMSKVRLEVRRALERLDPELQTRLRVFYQSHRGQLRTEGQPQGAYISLALLLSGPPELSLDIKVEDMPQDVLALRGFEELVREVYRSAEIEALWRRFRPQYEQEIQEYVPVVREVIQSTLDYFRIPPRIVLDRQIILTPDLLDVKEIVNARNLEQVYYIVVGPSDDPANNRRQLEHEYLHFLLDPLIRKFGVSLLAREELLNLAQRQPRIREEYQNKFSLIIAESLIEAIQLRRATSASEPRGDLRQLFRRGLIFAPLFYGRLTGFEEDRLMAMPVFVESLLSDVSESVIKQDEASIVAWEKEARSQSQDQTSRDDPRSDLKRTLFADASQLLEAGRFEEAQEKLTRLLELDPESSNALFYMAQALSQTGDHDRALDYYTQAADKPDVTPWIRAWSLLRSGRILASRQDFAQARRLFDQVAALDGDLRGAQEEARKLLQLLPRDDRS